jgi:hypothetical protein
LIILWLRVALVVEQVQILVITLALAAALEGM